MATVFERFTDRARRVLVLAQEEARDLGDSFIGTEHVAYGLAAEGSGGEPGIASQVLAAIDINAESVDDQIRSLREAKPAEPMGSPPFTPRAKRVLELALREALQLGHNYIGTEHMLLGLVREGEGTGWKILVDLGASAVGIRQAVTKLLGSYAPKIADTPPLARLYTPAEVACRVYELRDDGRSLVDSIDRLVDEGMIVLRPHHG